LLVETSRPKFALLHMQFQVPQFIETEDHIIGPLTLKQFIYVAIAFGISFGLFFILKPLIWVFIALPLGGFAAAMAFVKIHGRPLPSVVMSMIHFYWNPQQYIWQPEHVAEKPVVAKKEEEEGTSIEKIVAGFALKSAWRTVQTGSKAPEIKLPAQKPVNERYEVFRKPTGEKRAAKRVDYR
jgi:hypothetical protein